MLNIEHFTTTEWKAATIASEPTHRYATAKLSPRQFIICRRFTVFIAIWTSEFNWASFADKSRQSFKLSHFLKLHVVWIFYFLFFEVFTMPRLWLSYSYLHAHRHRIRYLRQWWHWMYLVWPQQLTIFSWYSLNLYPILHLLLDTFSFVSNVHFIFFYFLCGTEDFVWFNSYLFSSSIILQFRTSLFLH